MSDEQEVMATSLRFVFLLIIHYSSLITISQRVYLTVSRPCSSISRFQTKPARE
jgi:hypothetical protein